MPSLFPGMDPYLEDPDVWPDFHSSLYQEIRAELNSSLPPGYVARMDRYVWIHEPDAEERTLIGKPDVYVADTVNRGPSPRKSVALVSPNRFLMPAIKHQGNRYLKVLDAKHRRVVTVVEILSPSNKRPGKDRDAYLMKRNEYLGSGVSLVEIDLLRSGEGAPWGESPRPKADYFILVSRATDWPAIDPWAISVREALPDIPIPLPDNVDDVILPLQLCVTRAFDKGRYLEDIDYSLPPIPPLNEPDATWAHELVARSRTKDA